MTSSYLGVDDSSKKWKIVISCYNGKLLYLELFTPNLYFFTPWEVLESWISEQTKRDRDKVSLNQMIIKFHNTFILQKWYLRFSDDDSSKNENSLFRVIMEIIMLRIVRTKY